MLDLDNDFGMRSETVAGDVFAWKKLPQFLLKLCLENPFLFDFVKYETMRAEIDHSAVREISWVLWEGKNRPPQLNKLGCLSGLLYEYVH